MSDCRWGTAIAVALIVSLPPSALEARHFSWLGHGPCPQQPCDRLVPQDFTALGEFTPKTWALLDEAASPGRPEERTEMLRTPEGRDIARVTVAFRRRLDDAGAGRLRDGRIVNIAEKTGGEFRYLAVPNAPFGLGSPGYRLVPYRTVAVQPRRIPLGTVLYIPILVGMVLPSGEVHDGFCFAHDADPELKPTQIGLFVGFDPDDNPTLKPFTSARTIQVYRVSPMTATTLNRRFKAQFDWSD